MHPYATIRWKRKCKQVLGTQSLHTQHTLSMHSTTHPINVPIQCAPLTHPFYTPYYYHFVHFSEGTAIQYEETIATLHARLEEALSAAATTALLASITTRQPPGSATNSAAKNNHQLTPGMNGNGGYTGSQTYSYLTRIHANPILIIPFPHPDPEPYKHESYPYLLLITPPPLSSTLPSP